MTSMITLQHSCHRLNRARFSNAAKRQTIPSFALCTRKFDVLPNLIQAWEKQYEAGQLTEANPVERLHPCRTATPPTMTYQQIKTTTASPFG
jgi:hypothetical protein